MKNYSRLAVLISTASAIGASAVAAPMQGRGMASVMPLGLSIDSGGQVVPGATLDPVRVKAPLNQSSPPATWASVASGLSIAGPKYSSFKLFGADKDIVDIDGQSRGRDQVPMPDALGAPNVGTQFNNWLAYVVSVKEGAIGVNDGHINKVHQTGAPTGSELLGFYTERSQQIDSALPGTTRIEATARSLGYDGTLANTEDVDAVDYGIGVSTYGGANSSSSIVFQASDFYFYSVTNASAFDLNVRHAFAYADDGTGNLKPATGGDIYVLEWLGTQWSAPEIYKTASDLGLNQGEDVDALSVTKQLNSDVIVFSTARNTSPTTRPQLLISTGTGTSTELTDLDATGTVRTNVFDRIDLSREWDDVDGLCGIDPRDHDIIDRVIGTTVTSLAKTPVFASKADMIDVSLVRSRHALTQQESLMLQVSGWGEADPQDSDMLVMVYQGNTAIPSNADPSELDLNGAPLYPWAPFPVLLDRQFGQDQLELTIPFDVGNSQTHLAVCVLLFAKPSDGGGLIAGSGVTQLAY